MNPPGMHLAGNFRALLRRHAQTLIDPTRGAVEQAAELIDQMRLEIEKQHSIVERLDGQHEERVRRGAVMEAALRMIMRMADEAKEPCSIDPESPAAIRNGKFASIAQVAAQGLGWISGPPLDEPSDRKEVALLLNKLVLMVSAKATQPPGLPQEDRITDADVDELEARILALAPVAQEPPIGLYALRDVVRSLRETGRFVDEEGEATNALDDLAGCLGQASAAPPFASGGLPRLPAPTEMWTTHDSTGRALPAYGYTRHQMYEYARQAVHLVDEELLGFARWLLEAYHSEEGMPEAKEIAKEARAAIEHATGEQQRPRSTLDALREMVHQGTVFVSAWVVFDEVRSYRVTARGRDGWRKTGDAKTLEDAIHEAGATNWSPAPRL